MSIETAAAIFYITGSIAALLIIGILAALLFYAVPTLKLIKKVVKKISAFFINLK